MDFLNLKKIELVAESFYEKYSNNLNLNSDIEDIKNKYSKSVKNNCEQNFTTEKLNEIDFDTNVEKFITFYQNLLNEKFLTF